MMSAQHSNSCGRCLARDIDAAGGSKYDAALAVHQHCGVSLLRAHRIAYGYTLVEATDTLREILRSRGVQYQGLAHQRLSKWESGQDVPTPRYLDALCALYRTRPDRLGFGHDYSNPKPSSTPASEKTLSGGTFLNSTVASVLSASSPLSMTELLMAQDSIPDQGKTAVAYVNLLEDIVDQAGYLLYTTSPSTFIPSRMVDLARIKACLLSFRTADIQHRLHKLYAKTAGFIAIRIIDVASLDDAVWWSGVARRAARRTGDANAEAWITGHLCNAYAWHNRSLKSSLKAARAAQAIGCGLPSATAVYGHLAEAAVQARMGRRQETMDAVRNADRMFAALPGTETTADGCHITEYFLRWHQSNALTAVGVTAEANALRKRALELPFSQKDKVGQALLRLDEAASTIANGNMDSGRQMVGTVIDRLPSEYRIGLVSRRANQILTGSVPGARSRGNRDHS